MGHCRSLNDQPPHPCFAQPKWLAPGRQDCQHSSWLSESKGFNSPLYNQFFNWTRGALPRWGVSSIPFCFSLECSFLTAKVRQALWCLYDCLLADAMVWHHADNHLTGTIECNHSSHCLFYMAVKWSSLLPASGAYTNCRCRPFWAIYILLFYCTSDSRL